MPSLPIKLSFWLPAEQFLPRLAPDQPVLALLGPDRFSIVATCFDLVDDDEFLQQRWPSTPAGNSRGSRGMASDLPFLSGYIGALAYDDFSGQASDQAASRIYRIRQGLLFDNVKKECWAIGDEREDVPFNLQPPFAVDETPWHLEPCSSVRRYVEEAKEVIEEVRGGRFYQLNLLRYFAVDLPQGRAAWRAQALGRLGRWGGPMSCLFATEDVELISFSPERFLSVAPTDQGWRAVVNPIKGTSARSLDPHEDQRTAANLLRSEKDLAELHMIVDLMRNDLSAVSLPRSVQVEAADRLRSFPSVHHLEAVVTSLLRPDLSLRSIFQALCPAGSITGAPKREVMLAIAEREQRARGFFMGNAFYLDDRGYFDSSVLIRSLQRTSSGWQYAAGSGLTVRSDPEVEAREIETKCQVVTAFAAGGGASRQACYSASFRDEIENRN